MNIGGNDIMRKGVQSSPANGYKIIAVDDEVGIIDSLSIFLKRSGYDFSWYY